MSLKQKILNKAIEVEKNKILRLFLRDPIDALGHILSRCGVHFTRAHDTFEIELNDKEVIIITVKKKAK